MSRRNQRRAKAPARPIRTKRDYKGAAAVVRKMSGQTDRNSAAELRLQSLLREMDEFDDPEDDTSSDFPGDSIYSGPRRRWSDDTPGVD
jgi:hypothetical protein